MDKRVWYTNFLLAQLFLILFILCNYIFGDFKLGIIVVVLIMVLETMFNIFFFCEMNRLYKKQHEAIITQLQLDQAQQLVLSFRAKHHDIINHFQVIMGLVQMNKYDEAVNYMKTLSDDLIQIEKLLTLKRPEIAALISTKVTELNYLRLSLEITTSLENLSVSPEKMVSIMGNIIDNAIYETSLKSDKWMEIKISEDKNWYLFEVKNPGFIPESARKRIFEPGFTTKGEKGTGMGLYIVKNLVSTCGGTVEYQIIGGDAVSFVVRLPKKKAPNLDDDRSLEKESF